MSGSRGSIVTPKFWDLHLHGVAGVDFMRATEDAMAHACVVLGREGTGVFSPTLLTSEPHLLHDACLRWGSCLKHCEKPGFLPRGAARPLGLHLEGPFLSPDMAGAHPRDWLAKPSVAHARELLKLTHGHVSIVTLAP